MAAEEDKAEKQVHEVHEGRRVGAVVSVRLKPDEAELLEALSEREGRTMSETLRAALHALANTPQRPEVSVVGEEGSFTRGGYSPEEEIIAATS